MKTVDNINNFTILRLVFATLVVVGHFIALPGTVPTYRLFGYADFPIDAFFIISGYLVTDSFDRKPHVGGFYIRRVFRIYPLYLTIILIQAVAMLVLLGGISEHMPGLVKYLAYNLVFANFLSHDIDGLLSGINNPGINPSLWTLKIEMGYYLILPLLYYGIRRWGFIFLLLTFLASTVFFELCTYYGKEALAKQLPAQLRFFIVGMALWRYRDRIVLPLPLTIAATLGVLGFCMAEPYPFLRPLYPVCTGLFVFLCAVRLPALPMNLDISYGVYLIHGPIIQLMLFLGLLQTTPLFLAGLLVTVYTLAFLAELLIERPGIELGRRIERACIKHLPNPR